MGRGRGSHDDSPRRRSRAPDGPPATIGQIRRNSCWIWLYCNAPGCHASVAVALAVDHPPWPGRLQRRSQAIRAVFAMRRQGRDAHAPELERLA